MINAALILAVVATGVASQYGPGRMESNIAIRQAGLTSKNLPSALPAVHGYVAGRYAEDIGKIVYLRPAGCEDCRFERFLIADCSGSDETLRWMLRGDILFEMGHESVLRWGEKLDRNLIGRGIKIEVAVETEAPMYE